MGRRDRRDFEGNIHMRDRKENKRTEGLLFVSSTLPPINYCYQIKHMHINTHTLEKRCEKNIALNNCIHH